MKKSVLVFGTKFDLVKRLQDYGLKVILVDEVESTEADVCYVVNGPDAAVGSYDVDMFLEHVEDICGLLVCLEDYVEFAAATREKHFSYLSGLKLEQAKIVRDKFLLKEFLLKNDIPTARFSEITDFEKLEKKVGLPFIVKPRRGFLAQGIKIFHTKEEYTTWQNDPHVGLGGFYAEEYIQRPTEYCCDTIVANSKVIAQFSGEYTVSCLESNNKHEGFGVNFPGFMPAHQLEEIKAHTRKFVDKLGVANGFFHTEFLWDGARWYFGESGCRLPGGLQIPTESYVSGVDLLDLYIKMFVPHLKKIEIEPIVEFASPYVGYYLYPKKVGLVKKITSHIPTIKDVLSSNVYIQVGDHIDFEDSSVSMTASVIYKSTSLENQLKWIKQLPGMFEVEYLR